MPNRARRRVNAQGRRERGRGPGAAPLRAGDVTNTETPAGYTNYGQPVPRGGCRAKPTRFMVRDRVLLASRFLTKHELRGTDLKLAVVLSCGEVSRKLITEGKQSRAL